MRARRFLFIRFWLTGRCPLVCDWNDGQTVFFSGEDVDDRSQYNKKITRRRGQGQNARSREATMFEKSSFCFLFFNTWKKRRVLLQLALFGGLYHLFTSSKSLAKVSPESKGLLILQL